MNRGCHCLCAANHPDARGICKGSVDLDLRFTSSIGDVDVAMCSPCAAATLAEKAGEASG